MALQEFEKKKLYKTSVAFLKPVKSRWPHAGAATRHITLACVLRTHGTHTQSSTSLLQSAFNSFTEMIQWRDESGDREAGNVQGMWMLWCCLVNQRCMLGRRQRLVSCSRADTSNDAKETTFLILFILVMICWGFKVAFIQLRDLNLSEYQHIKSNLACHSLKMRQ